MIDLELENQKIIEARALATKDNDKNKIGLLAEHTLHRTLKFYLSKNEYDHEILINKMFADVVIDNHIYEVQTKRLTPLRKKIIAYLGEYKVSIIHPLIKEKRIHIMDENNKEIRVRKSPVHSNYSDIFYDIYPLKDFLLEKNLDFSFMFIGIDEYRIPNFCNRSKYERLNQIPYKIIEIIKINSASDFLKIFDFKRLPEIFKSKDIERIAKTNASRAWSIIQVLLACNLIEICGKESKSYLYKFV